MKNQDLLLFVLLAVFGFLIWNRSVNERFTDVSASTPVAPAVIQNIITSIQDKDPDLYPIQTVYINPFGGDQGSMVYNARIIFLNTRGYFGIQYDVQADGNGKILNMNMQAHPNALGPFMGYTEDKGCGELDDEQSESGGWQKRRHVDRTSDKQRQEQRQAESEVGRDAHGAAGWMDYAELCVSCDNRTDELRLLGNGVVPATAARAFTVLMEELLA